jgi:hypothetical protein
MEGIIDITNELSKQTNEIIIDLSDLIKTKNLVVGNALSIISNKVDNRKIQFLQDLIINGNNTINYTSSGISDNNNTIRLKDTGLFVLQNLNIGGNIYIDYATESFGNDYSLLVEGGLVSNIGYLNDIVIEGNINNKGNIILNKLINEGTLIVSNSIVIKNDLYCEGNIKGNNISSIRIYSNNIITNNISNVDIFTGRKVESKDFYGNIFIGNNVIIPYVNISNASMIYVDSVNNIYTNFLNSSYIEVSNINISGIIDETSIFGSNINANTLYGNGIIFTNLNLINMTLSNLYVGNILDITSVEIINFKTNKVTTDDFITLRDVYFNDGLTITGNCKLKGEKFQNNIDGITIGDQYVFINTDKINYDTGIVYAYLDNNIGYIYDATYHNFIFGNIERDITSNVVIRNKLPIHIGGLEGDSELYIGQYGNIRIDGNIYINGDMYSKTQFIGNEIYSNNGIVYKNLTANYIISNIISQVSYIYNSNGQLFVSNLDSRTSNFYINNLTVIKTANIINLSANNLIYSFNYGNLVANTVGNVGSINDMIVSNLYIDSNIVISDYYKDNVNFMHKGTVDFVNQNKTLNKVYNIIINNIECNIGNIKHSNERYIINDTINQLNLKFPNSNIKGKMIIDRNQIGKFISDKGKYINLNRLSVCPEIERSYLTGSINSGFGYSCKINDKYLIVGAPYDNNRRGNVYVYDTNFNLIKKLEPINNQIKFLGGKVDMNLSGNIIISSGVESNINNISNCGAVCIYEDNDKIILSSNIQYNFGESISINSIGNKIIVGQSSIGNVYIYSKSGIYWKDGYSTSYLSGINSFGRSVRIGNDNLIAISGNNYVNIYENSSLVQQLLGVNNFGYDIIFADDCMLLIISSPDIIGYIDIFKMINRQYIKIQTITSTNYDYNPYQGFSLTSSYDGTIIIYGGPYNGGPNYGAIWIWIRKYGIWKEYKSNMRYEGYKSASQYSTRAHYEGYSVSMNNNGVLVVGGYGDYQNVVGNGSVGIFY